MQLRTTIACCLSLVALGACSVGIDQQKFDGLYRAGKGMTGATGVGVNIMKYGELLQTFASEVSIAGDRVKGSDEKAMVDLYREGLQAYSDARVVWTAKIKESGTLLSLGDPELKRIADEYPITGQGSGSGFRFDPDAAVQVIWSRASAKLAAAERLYNGQSDDAALPTVR